MVPLLTLDKRTINSCPLCIKLLQEELESVQREGQKKDETLNRLEQQLHDAGEEKKLQEKKGAAVMKDLRRQLAAERKRAEKLQERMQDILNEGTHVKTGNCHIYLGYERNGGKFYFDSPLHAWAENISFSV